VDAAWVDGASAQKGNELQGGPPHYGLTRSSQSRRMVMIGMVYWLIWLLWYKAVLWLKFSCLCLRKQLIPDTWVHFRGSSSICSYTPL
jgi:nitrate reductase alpha subunit